MSFYQDGDYWELPSEEEEGGDEKDEERGGRGGAYYEENIDFDDLVRKNKYFCAKLSFRPVLFFRLQGGTEKEEEEEASMFPRRLREEEEEEERRRQPALGHKDDIRRAEIINVSLDVRVCECDHHTKAQ